MRIIQITPQITQYNSAQTGFLGNKIYRDAKKKLTEESKFRYELSQAEKQERFMGSLPKEWISSFRQGSDADSIKKNTERTYKAFAEFTEHASMTPVKHAFSCKYYKTGLYENLKNQRGTHYLEPAQKWEENIKRLQKALNKVFDGGCTVQFVEDASFGMVFKITIGGKTCALKTFYPNEYIKRQCSRGHGPAYEIRNAIHLSNAMKASQTSRFYCAKVPIGPEIDGFMLTSFQENSKNNAQSEKQRQEWFSQDRLYWGKFALMDAHNDNFAGGKLIDYGAIRYSFSSPKAQKMAKEFFTMISRGDIEGVKKFKEEHEGEREFAECMARLLDYIGEEEDLETIECFAEHCYARGLTKKIIASFEALGADYSQFKDTNLSTIRIEKHRQKMEEIFNNKKEF